jgi:hypothetical protein
VYRINVVIPSSIDGFLLLIFPVPFYESVYFDTFFYGFDFVPIFNKLYQFNLRRIHGISSLFFSLRGVAVSKGIFNNSVLYNTDSHLD